MRKFSKVWERWRFFVRRSQLDRELEEEIRTHLELEMEENVEAGMNPEEARHAAHRAFGNVALIKEDTREVWGFPWLERLWQDLRYGARMLIKTPGLTLVAILSLGLGIGATSTIFTVINTLVLRPLPYENAEQLVVVRESRLDKGGDAGASTANLLDWREQNQLFEQIELILGGGGISRAIKGPGFPLEARFGYVTSGIFEMLRVKPVLGQTWSSEGAAAEEAPEQLVVISHGLWQRHFGGDPQVLSQPLRTSKGVHTIIGVLPAGFRFFPGGQHVDYWALLDTTNPNWISRGKKWNFATARLKSDVTLSQAQAEMDTIAARLEEAYPEANKGWGVKLVPLQEALSSGFRGYLYPLFGAVVFILLIASANVAGLLLSRASKREREVAIRSSLGAGRFRLIRQMLTESVLLSFLGGVVGLLLIFWGIELFLGLAPPWFPKAITVDGRVVGFTAAVSLLTGILFGLAPAWHTSKPDLSESLKEGGRGSAGRSRHRTLAALIVAEVALVLVLLIGAGLMINSFVRLQRVDPGFNPENLLTMEIRLEGAPYQDRSMGATKRGDELVGRATPQVESFYKRLIEQTETLPGVQSAAVIDWLPCWRGREAGFRIAGQPDLPPAEQPRAVYNSVSADFFETMEIPLKRGRRLSPQDVRQSPWVAVINEAMARKFWSDQEAIGKVITLNIIEEERPREIVGIVADIRHRSLDRAPEPAIYISHLQQPEIYRSGNFGRFHKSLIIRTRTGARGLADAVRRIVAQIDKDQLVYGIRSMEKVLSLNRASLRLYMFLLGIFAGLAVLLAAIGVYGVISYSVSERTNEIGIRMALGAEQRDVLWLILKRGVKLAAIGIAIGLVGSFAATRALSKFLFGVKPHDPVTVVIVCLVLFGIAVSATYFPARRAMRVNPMEALRQE